MSSVPKHELLKKSRSRKRGRREGHRNPPMRAVTHRELNGGALQVAINPPPVSHQPWNAMTVVHIGTSGDITITLGDLCNQMAEQMDPIKDGLSYKNTTGKPLQTIFNVKMHKIRAWNITGNIIALSVDDYSDAAKAISDVDALCGLVDTGSSQHTPAVGFELPASHKNIVLRNGNAASDTKAVLYHIMLPQGDTAVIYTTILWKFDGPAKLSSFEHSMMHAMQSIAESTAATSANSQELVDTLKGMEQSQSKLGIGTFVQKGLKVAAPYIIPAIADDLQMSVHNIETRLENVQKQLSSLQVRSDSSPSIREWIDSMPDNAEVGTG